MLQLIPLVGTEKNVFVLLIEIPSETKGKGVKLQVKSSGQISELEADIVKHYPKDFTRKLRSGKRDPKSNLTIMREILRYNHRHLLSIRGFKWCKQKKKSVAVYTYSII